MPTRPETVAEAMMAAIETFADQCSSTRTSSAPVRPRLCTDRSAQQAQHDGHFLHHLVELDAWNRAARIRLDVYALNDSPLRFWYDRETHRMSAVR